MVRRGRQAAGEVSDLQGLGPASVSVTADIQRLRTELGKLASFSETPAPAVTRVVFGDMDLRARDYLKTLFADASLVVHEDPVGNTFARWLGRSKSLPPIATGSHCEPIP